MIIKMLTKRITGDTLGATAGSQKSGTANEVEENKFERARKNTLKTLIIVACCFVICYIQNQILFFMSNLGYQVDWDSTYYHFTVLMMFLNSTINPFIYTITYNDYQVALREFCCGSQSRSDGNQSQSVSVVSNPTPATSQVRI